MFPFHSVSQTGFLRLQTAFAGIIFIILAFVLCAVGANYLKLHGTEHALESARTLDTLLAQYATDNGDVYPVGEGTRAEGTSEGIALDLLLNNFTPNADLFSVGSTPRYAGTAKDYADLTAQNMSWDFTAGPSVTTGIKSDAPDSLPVLYTTGETVDYQPGKDLALSGQGPFRGNGIIVAFKSGEVSYRQAQTNVVPAFVSPHFTSTGTYTQIKP